MSNGHDIKAKYHAIVDHDQNIVRLFATIEKKYPNGKLAVPAKQLIVPLFKSRARNFPRPQNAFVLFRKEYSAFLRLSGIYQRVGENSRTAAAKWSKLPKDDKQYWVDLAGIAKRIHTKLYPGYKYEPGPPRKTKKFISRSGLDQQVGPIPTPQYDFEASTTFAEQQAVSHSSPLLAENLVMFPEVSQDQFYIDPTQLTNYFTEAWQRDMFTNYQEIEI